MALAGIYSGIYSTVIRTIFSFSSDITASDLMFNRLPVKQIFNRPCCIRKSKIVVDYDFEMDIIGMVVRECAVIVDIIGTVVLECAVIVDIIGTVVQECAVIVDIIGAVERECVVIVDTLGRLYVNVP
ncbi:hypothetical protein CHS0354_026012 [Potamilus streckersoni]|uniref:Uncharacterized protein n=1 Tax=Potamilus streckersoni TaxID=2493646 RepID=A0AAE0VLA3_9BIVA|nr:hypothetical protein CHS0354_026012 [Potamilus streckersoni]